MQALAAIYRNHPSAYTKILAAPNAVNVPPYAVVAGIPAKKVGERPQVLTYEFKGNMAGFY